MRVTDLHIGHVVKMENGTATVTAEPVDTGNETLLVLDGKPRWVLSRKLVTLAS